MTDELKNFIISFIIPVLNGEKHIGQCLDHIFREMDDNDEIIVVDNGSIDDTLKIIKRYKKVTILIFPEVTIAALRNRGADIAKGDILAFIDSDCLVCEGWRNAAVSIMNDGKISATGSRVDISSSAGWIEKAWYSNRLRKQSKINYINSGNLVVRKDIFKVLSGFKEELETDEDCDFGDRLNNMGCCMIEAPQIRVIHLGNAKTLREFFKKEKWHATSILSTMSLKKVDKPMIMTFIFMICLLISISMLPFFLFFNLNPIIIALLILLAPLMTVLYRVYQYKNYRYFFHLIILYFLYYLVRSITVMKALLTFIFRR